MLCRFTQEKTYVPWEVRAKVGHQLLSQVYFLHTFALSGRKYAKNILDLKVDGTLSLLLRMAYTSFLRKTAG